MNLTCIECKNEIDLNSYSNLAVGNIVECNHCGITLEVTDMSEGGEMKVEIVDEGK